MEIQNEISRKNISAIDRLLNRLSNSEIYDKAINQVYEAKKMISELNKRFPYSLCRLQVVVQVQSLRILSDLTHDLNIQVKEVDNGIFVAELKFEGGTILIKTT